MVHFLGVFAPHIGLGGKKWQYFGTFRCAKKHRKGANDHHNFHRDGHFAQNDPFRGKKFQQIPVGKNHRNFVKISEKWLQECLFRENATSGEH